MRTLPEPSNFNICWTGLPLHEPIRIRGELPPARINSLTIYPRASSDPPATLDLETLPQTSTVGRERMIDVVLTSSPSSSPSTASSTSKEKDSDNQLYRRGVLTYPDHWKGGFIALRNFSVPNGTRVVTPEITRLRDGKILRKSEVLVAGITSITNVELNKVRRVLLFNLLSCFACFYFSILPTLELILTVHFMGALIGYLCSSSFFYLGMKGLAKHIQTISPVPHELKLADIEHASTASQPSQEHRYWLMKYNTKKINYDLIIQFRIKSSYQKYWSLVVYDVYGIPIQQFVNLENVIWLNKNKKSEKKNEKEEEEECFISLRLTRFPPRSSDSSLVLQDQTIQDDMKAMTLKSPNILFGHSTIDITSVPIGYVIFRIVHPTTSKVIEYSQPTVKLAKTSKESDVSKDIHGGYFVDVMM